MRMPFLFVRSTFRASLLALITFSGTAIAGEISVDAPIADVTVYPDRAVVTRAASTDLSSGINEVTIPGLTANLVDDSLQVMVRGDGKLTLLDVRSATGFSAPAGIERLQPLLDRETELEAEIEKTNQRLAVFQQQREFLAGIEKAATAPRTEGDLPNLQEWADLMTFFEERLTDLLPRIHEADMEKVELEEELKAVQRQIAQTRGAERTSVKNAVVRISADEPVRNVEISISYVVMNAGWQPNYNLRVASADRSIRLDYQAMVRQQTGEDWSDVALTLSTARPSLGGTPPELGLWRVEEVRPVPPPVPLLQSRAKEAMPADALAFGRVTSEAADMAKVAVEESLTAVNLRVPSRVVIPADGQPHRVGISGTELVGEFYYTAVPKLSPHAFLQSRVTYEGEAPLLPGNASILMDGNLIGQSRIERVDPREEFDVSLGVDEAIQIERKLLRRLVEPRGLINKSVRTRFEFLTTVTNNRPTAERIVIRDHLPVSQHERIEVKAVELSGGKPEEGKPGHYRWELDLAPREKVELPLTFTIEHPEEMEVSGL